jgi:hypothetical protein
MKEPEAEASGSTSFKNNLLNIQRMIGGRLSVFDVTLEATSAAHATRR